MRLIFDRQIDLIVDLLKDQVAQLIGKDKYRKIVITMLSFRDLLQESLASIEGIPNSVRRLVTNEYLYQRLKTWQESNCSRYPSIRNLRILKSDDPYALSCITSLHDANK